MTTTIDDYKVGYFVPIARATLDGPLSAHGFSYGGDYRGVSAHRCNGSVFLTVSYLPETSPAYELQIAVGLGDVDPAEPKSPANSIAVWRLLPSHLEQIAGWRFDGPEKLSEQLRSAWTQAVLPYVEPLWYDEAALAHAIDEQRAQLAREDAQLMDERLLRHARAEFTAGRFADAVHAFGELPADRLTAADRKRVEIGRRHVQ